MTSKYLDILFLRKRFTVTSKLSVDDFETKLAEALFNDKNFEDGWLNNSGINNHKIIYPYLPTRLIKNRNKIPHIVLKANIRNVNSQTTIEGYFCYVLFIKIYFVLFVISMSFCYSDLSKTFGFIKQISQPVYILLLSLGLYLIYLLAFTVESFKAIRNFKSIIINLERN